MIKISHVIFINKSSTVITEPTNVNSVAFGSHYQSTHRGPLCDIDKEDVCTLK